MGSTSFSLVKILRDLPLPAEAVEEKRVKRLRSSTPSALETDRGLVLHVMHVTPFVSTLRRMHQPGSSGSGGGSSSPGGDPGLARETRW